MKYYQAIVQNTAIVEKCGIYGAPHYLHLQDTAIDRQKRITDLLPSGSGFDSGTKLISATDSKIVFNVDFHHMNENGYYDGWTIHKVAVKPSLMHGFMVTCSGKNKNAIKEYIEEVFASLMLSDFEWIKK